MGNIYREMLDYYEQHGGSAAWFQGDFTREHDIPSGLYDVEITLGPEVCLLGAAGYLIDGLYYQSDDFFYHVREVNELIEVIQELYADRSKIATWQNERLEYVPAEGHDVIVQFNDHCDTTYEDIVTVLEKAAMKRDEKIGD